MQGQSGMPGNEYADGMIEHDGNVGKLLKALDDLGIANNTIVVYTTDNGPNQFSWPDAATTPFRSREGHELGGRFPRAGDGPLAGQDQGGRRSPTRCSPASTGSRRSSPPPAIPTIKERAAQGHQPVGDTTFKVHLDGYNQLAYLTGQRPTRAPAPTSPTSTTTASWSPSGTSDWKAVFCEMEQPGGFAVWYEPFTCLRIPKLFNLRMDPYERADIVSDQYDDWRVENAYLMGWMTLHAAAFLETFVEYPPSQPPASFTIDQVEATWRRRSGRKPKPWGRRPTLRNPTGN